MFICLSNRSAYSMDRKPRLRTNGELPVCMAVQTSSGPGRGQRGRGRGHNKGTITITIRALERQKEPSVTPIFYKLRQNNCPVTAEVAASSPVVPAIDSKDLRINWRPIVTIELGSDKGPISPLLLSLPGIFLLPSDPCLTPSSLQPCSVQPACSSSLPVCKHPA
jgi:hypothetical protein